MNSLLIHIEIAGTKRHITCEAENYTDLRRAIVHALFEDALKNEKSTMEAYNAVAKIFGMHTDSVRRIIAGRQ